MNTFKKGWYVLYVKPRSEKKVNNQLQQYLFTTYLPLVKELRQWSDRKKIIHQPLFPSYLFVYIDHSPLFAKVLNFDMVMGFIKFNKEFARVKDQEIKNIQLLLKKDYANIEILDAKPQVGEVRLIKEGILNGLECEIIKAENVNKILVKVSSINMHIMATLSVTSLQNH